MEWKTILYYYLGALATFLVYFLGALWIGKVFKKDGDIDTPALIIHCVILLIVFVGATLGVSRELEKAKKELLSEEGKEKLAPKIDIKLFPFPSGAVTPYKYPFKKYVLGIQNLNKNSTPILDFRIEFIFKNRIIEIKQMPLVDAGGDFSVMGMKYYEEKKDGTSYSYEELPVETSITKNFSFEIQKANINGNQINTNMALFNCERWPAGTAFSSDIIVDLLDKPEFLKKPDKVGTYIGEYYYEFNGQKFSEKVSGPIPDVDTQKESDRAGTNKEYWSRKFAEIDSREGTIAYTTRDERWLERNNYFIDFIPHIEKGNFEIHIYRDSDNVFKVLMSTDYSKKINLEYKDLDKLITNKTHPKHDIVITWEKSGEKLYIDGNLVDSHDSGLK